MDTPERRLADELRLARLKARLTQKQVAERSGLRQSRISNLETKYRGASAVDLIKITKAIGVSIDKLAKDAGI